MSDPKSPPCIYCGKVRKLSAEHILPEMIYEIIPALKRTHTHSQILKGIHYDMHGAMTEEAKSHSVTPQNPVGQRVIKNVCKVCNETWMSELNNRVKPHLTELCNGIWQRFDFDLSVRLAQWQLMVSMNIDASYPDTMTFSSEFREKFRLDRDLPGHCYFYAGLLSGDFPTIYSKRSFSSIAEIFTIEKPGFGGATITVVLKQLVLHMLHHPKNDPPLDPYQSFTYGRDLGLLPIQPWVGNALDWRQAPILRFDDVINIVNKYAAIRRLALGHYFSIPMKERHEIIDKINNKR